MPSGKSREPGRNGILCPLEVTLGSTSSPQSCAISIISLGKNPILTLGYPSDIQSMKAVALCLCSTDLLLLSETKLYSNPQLTVDHSKNEKPTANNESRTKPFLLSKSHKCSIEHSKKERKIAPIYKIDRSFHYLTQDPRQTSRINLFSNLKRN
jgi:hypothetical protein